MPAIAPGVINVLGPRSSNFVARTPIPHSAFTAADGGILGAGGAGTFVQSQASASPTLAAVRTRTSFDDWYYRVHVVPQSINLGNMSGDRTVQIQVWNAYFSPVTVEDFDFTQVEGVSVVEPQETPIEVGALRSLDYTLLVSASGPSQVSATLAWVVDGVEYVVPVTGRRSVTFGYRPNWARGAMMETYTWATTVTRAWNGREQRMGTSKSVRRSISYQALVLDSLERQKLDSMMYGWQGRAYSLPLWNEATRTTADVAQGALVVPVDTTQLTVAVGATMLIYLKHGALESVEVDAFDAVSITVKAPLSNAWPAGAKVVPTVAAFPAASSNSTRPVPEYAALQVSFVIDPSIGMNRVQVTPAAQLYRGTELYLVETDWATDLSIDLEANRRESDSGLGPIRMLPKGEFPSLIRSFRWLCKTRDDATWLRNFFHRRRGRLNPVWVPSGVADFTVVAPIGASDTIVRVADNEYASFIAQQKARRDVVFILRDGRRFCRRIIDSATESGVGSLALDQGFGEEIPVEAVKRVSYLGFFRLAQDAVTFNWYTDQVAVVESSFALTEPDE